MVPTTILSRMRRLAPFALVLLAACSSGGGAAERHAEPGVPVVAARAVQEDAPVDLREIGTVEAYSTVTVKSQIEGTLAEVHFSEGQELHHGDLLFVIDPRPFEAALHQAEANEARDRAQAENARVEVGRLGRLLKSGIVSQDEYDRMRTQAQALEAAVAANRAAAEQARINLTYTRISSPIDGRIGRLLVHQGNLVKANDTTLAVINQLRPIYVSFAVPQQELPAIRRYMGERALDVRASLAAGANADGTLVFVNNAVDQATGTILLKALFPNADETLWPGQFVDVALRLTVVRDATVIPASAVQTGQQGNYVFVVTADGTVESRPVHVGETFDQHVVVRDGVAPGERVVTEGQLRLAPGTRVDVKEATG